MAFAKPKKKSLVSKRRKKQVAEDQLITTGFSPGQQRLIKALNDKKIGANVIRRASEDFSNYETEKLSTGELGMDIMLGGGFDRGAIIKLQGRFSAGKTRTALSFCKSFTMKGEDILYLDYEGRVRYKWVEQCGIDLKHFHYHRPRSMEECYDIAEGAIVTNAYSAIVIDSIAAMAPIEELGLAHAENGSRSKNARVTNTFMRKLQARFNELYNEGKTLPTLIILNQVRKNAGKDADKNPEFTPGGGQQDNTCTTIIPLFRGPDLTRDASEKEDGDKKDDKPKKGPSDVIGFSTFPSTMKHNGGSPHKRTSWTLLTDIGGFCGHPQYSYWHGDTFFRYGLKLGLVKAGGGGYYDVLGLASLRGKNAVREFLFVNAEARTKLVTAVREAVPFPIAFDENSLLSGIPQSHLAAVKYNGPTEESEEFDSGVAAGSPEPAGAEQKNGRRPRGRPGKKAAGKKSAGKRKRKGEG